MLNTKLILIEGFPGSGKSTATVNIGMTLQQQGIPCRWYLEDDDPHPIACLDFPIHGLAQRMVPLWDSFVDRASQDPTVTIIESRLWQNTALFMFMSECDLEEIIEFNRQVCQLLSPLSPVLVYLDQEDIEGAIQRHFVLRGEESMELELQETIPYPWFQSRQLTGKEAWIRFFKAWQPVVERLIQDWPYRKKLISNPHDDWDKANEQMIAFLQNG